MVWNLLFLMYGLQMCMERINEERYLLSGVYSGITPVLYRKFRNK